LRLSYAIAGAAFLVSILPLARLTFSAEFQSRVGFMSITNADYLRPLGGFSIPLVIKIFLRNMALNLSPKYLFLTGDGNLRHSTQRSGQWSWLEIFALGAGIAVAIRGRLFKNRTEAVTLALLAWAYLAGVIPAAMNERHESSIRITLLWDCVTLS
jgi:hypothetical protein